MLIGPGTLFEKAEGMAIAEVTDGTSNTLMVVESKDADSLESAVGPGLHAKDADQGARQLPPRRFNALFADGSVKFIKHSTSDTVVEALVTTERG